MPLHSVEVVPPPELVAVAVECDVLPPELDEDAKLDADADADAEDPLAVALAEEELVVKNWKARASPPLNVRASKRQGNANFLTILVMAISCSLSTRNSHTIHIIHPPKCASLI